MTIAQNLIENFSKQSKRYKDNFFHYSHGNRPWEIGLAYSFDRAAKTLDGVVAYISNPTLDFAAITTFALKDLVSAHHAQNHLDKFLAYDAYLDSQAHTHHEEQGGINPFVTQENLEIVRRAKQDVAADLKIIGLRSFQRATRQKHEWGERPIPIASGFAPTGITRTVYKSDVQVANLLTNNPQLVRQEANAELLSLAGFALVTVGTPLALIVNNYLAEPPKQLPEPVPIAVPAPTTP